MTKEKMKSNKILFLIILICLSIIVPLFLTGCSQTPYVTSIEKTGANGNVDSYTIHYSNGTTSTLTITNGKDGKDGDKGADGKDVSIMDIYNEYVSQYGNISYADFLKLYLTTSENNSKIINECLQSSLKVYTEFYVTAQTFTFYGIREVKTISIMCGSAIIYKIDNDYTYILTNYHVVYNANANSDNGGNIAHKIVGYLYGSEDEPTESSETNNGYAVYDYGDYGIEFEYVGGAIDYDIAVLRVETDKIQAINPNIEAIKLAGDYHVGETAIAIGNPENEGISVTQGIVSVDNEYITLNIDGTNRYYRSIRIDTSIYGGSSGGGLFNTYGELIGLTNAGDNQDQNINYAIPLQIVKGVANNILDNYSGTPITVKQISLGIETDGVNSKYIYDASTGYGTIKENIKITSVSENSIASTMNLQTGDIINSIIINNTEYSLNRHFEIDDILLNARIDDELKISYTRNNETATTSIYKVSQSDIS